jgi:hypothetical protein
MISPAISAHSSSTGTNEYAALLRDTDRAESAETANSGNRAARGAITGILLGASLWVVILALVGVIKL